MSRMTWLLSLVALLAVLALPCGAQACPSCAEAPGAMTGGEEEEQSINNPAAYNLSIYIMVGVPYFSLAVLAVLVYRGMKKNEAFRRAREAMAESGLPAAGPVIADQLT
jgi:hypothetical protein